MNKKYDLEDRLIKFSCSCLEICNLLPNTRVVNNLEYQLSKSSTAMEIRNKEVSEKAWVIVQRPLWDLV